MPTTAIKVLLVFGIVAAAAYRLGQFISRRAAGQASRVLGLLALTVVILSSLPALHLATAEMPFAGMSGDVGYGMAWMMMFGAAGLVACGCIASVTFSVLALRMRRAEPLAIAALVLTGITGLGIVAAVRWLIQPS